PIQLQCPKIIRISKLVPQLLEDFPISASPLDSYFHFKVLPQVFRDPVGIEQRVVHIEKENNLRPTRLFRTLVLAGVHRLQQVCKLPSSSLAPYSSYLLNTHKITVSTALITKHVTIGK